MVAGALHLPPTGADLHPAGVAVPGTAVVHPSHLVVDLTPRAGLSCGAGLSLVILCSGFIIMLQAQCPLNRRVKASMFQAYFKHDTSMFQACFKHVSSMFQA